MKSVLEIKTFPFINIEKMKYQLYYESSGRNCYVMNTKWDRNHKQLIFVISKVDFNFKEDKNAKKKMRY